MKLIAIIKNIEWEALLLAFFVFCACHPYFMWTINFIVPLAMKLLSIVILYRHTNLKGKNAGIFILWSGGLLISSILNFNLNLARIIDLLYVIPALFVNKPFLKKTYCYLVRVFSIFLSLSLLSWLGSKVGLVHSVGIIPPLNPTMEYDYEVFPLCVVPLSLEEAFVTRFHGLFDEPGVVGTYCMMFLYIEEFNLKKWYNIPLLIAGIASFSIAFVFGALVCGLFVLFTRKLKYSFRVVILLIVGVFFTKDIPIFQDLIYARLEWDSDKESIAGDNRTKDGQDLYLSSIRGSYEYYFGVQDKNKLQAFEGSWGYKNIILRDGLVFLLFYIFTFVFLALSRKIKPVDLWKFLALLLMVIYQRPDLYDLAKILLFVYLIDLYAEQKQIENSCKKRLIKDVTSVSIN